MSTNFDLKFTCETEVVGGQIYFYPKFSRTLTAVEASKLPSVNLSRGGTKMFRLDRLAEHNGHAANWNDGASIHTATRKTAYEMRVMNDLKAAWESFKAAVIKANTPQPVATPSGKRIFVAFNGS